MDIVINPLLISVMILAVCKAVDGYKKGMVKEIISLVSMAVLGATAALLAGAFSSYNDGKIFNVVVAVVLLTVLIIAHHLLKIVFFSAKLVSKLPVIHFVDKLLGVVFGLFEVVLLLWTVYTLVMMLELGAIEEMILSYTEDSRLLKGLYQYNYMALLVESILAKISIMPFGRQ